MINYRIARKNEFRQIGKMAMEAFGDYPLFNICFRHRFNRQEKYINFMQILHRIHIRTFARRNTCLVGTIDDQIVSMALVINPKFKNASIWDYVMAGGFNIFRKVGASGIKAIRDIEEQSLEYLNEKHPDAWLIGLIIVDPNHKGTGLGSQMLNDCVIPFVHENGGTQIVLNTNSEANRAFYQKNGFEEIDQHEISIGTRTITNWSYVMELDNEQKN